MSSAPIKSESIRNNTKSFPGVVDYSAGVIQEATTKAFNHKENKYGDKIKILVLDGAFTEGVSAYDVGVAHFLNPGLSKSEITQAVARSSRNCRSKNLLFLRVWDPFCACISTNWLTL